MGENTLIITLQQHLSFVLLSENCKDIIVIIKTGKLSDKRYNGQKDK